jgi:hypothetical protein
MTTKLKVLTIVWKAIPIKTEGKTPPAGSGGIFWLKAKNKFGPSDGRYIPRNESRDLYGGKRRQ